MTLIRHAWFAEGLASKKVDLEHARMEFGDFREIHAERPHCFHRRVDDDFLLRSKRWQQSCLQINAVGGRISTRRMKRLYLTAVPLWEGDRLQRRCAGIIGSTAHIWTGRKYSRRGDPQFSA